MQEKCRCADVRVCRNQPAVSSIVLLLLLLLIFRASGLLTMRLSPLLSVPSQLRCSPESLASIFLAVRPSFILSIHGFWLPTTIHVASIVLVDIKVRYSFHRLVFPVSPSLAGDYLDRLLPSADKSKTIPRTRRPAINRPRVSATHLLQLLAE